MSAETKLAGVVRALAEAMALSPELIAESPADYVHQLTQQLAAARAARDTVARDYQAASRGEEAALQQLADAEKRGAVKALREFADLHDRGLAEDARSLATVYEKTTAVTA